MAAYTNRRQPSGGTRRVAAFGVIVGSSKHTVDLPTALKRDIKQPRNSSQLGLVAIGFG